MARRGGMQEVELLDGGEPSIDEVGAPVRRRHGRRWIVVGVAAVALSLVATQWVVDARERAAVARLAAVPGVLPAFGDELTVARTITRADVYALWGGITAAGGVSASLDVAADGSQAFVGVDKDSGETLWSTPLLGPNAERAGSLENSFGSGCQSDAGPEEVATVAVCLVTDGFTRYATAEDSAGGDERVPATTTRAMVLDPADGRVLSERAVEPDAQLAVLNGLLLVGTRDAERLEVVAYDLDTGDERWTYDDARARLDETGDAQGSQYWGFMRAGDVVVYSIGSSLGLLSASGESVREDLWSTSGDEYGGGYMTDAVTGNLVLQDYATTGVQSTTLLAADGHPDADVLLEGGLLGSVVDDGSVPGLVLTSSDQLHAWDRRTGDPRWEAELQSTGSALVVRGRVYLTTSTGIAALDGRTGAVVWTQDLPSSSIGALATDGRDLLLSTAFDGGQDGAEQLGADATRKGMTGYDLATGDQTRFVPYPEDVFDVQVYGEMIIGWSPTSDDTYLLE
ncbi:PQQ-binding-like beta-propeller repeat protein [uncultured Cellulomonas sp.]|uniref:outer membrane protein assembly factor BamB family protein n=1 Tax=uncultured Cellulomonas sp. TaxID=189682 RepID=UPI0028F16E72|nr:PQQ-binding-like beta-propeller repeat protein [uncultured Cellulomonas sp.]